MYAEVATETAERITGSFERWTGFLETAARLYKYPFHEQLMIYAQRPEATACASFETWNETMRRYVKRGSKGIALIDPETERLRYVFDVSDTGTRENSRRLYLWEYNENEHFDAVSKALEQKYDVSGKNGIAEQLEVIAAQLADEFWNAHQRDILSSVEDSFLSDYDDFDVNVSFHNAATVSATYMLLSRCGLDPKEYFTPEDYLSVFDFNTPEAVYALGSAISETSEEILRTVETAVKNKVTESIPADPSVRNYSYAIVDGEVYFRENSVMVKPDLNATAKDRIKGLVQLRDCVRQLIDEQTDGYSDSEIKSTQQELNRIYDRFTAKFGLINTRPNQAAFSQDSAYYLLCSLEILDENKNLARKADIFTKRTIKPHEVVTSVDTAAEALALSVSEKACVDMSYMSELTGKDVKTLASDLRGVIFKDYAQDFSGRYTYRTADDFLSGNVRQKLKYYESIADSTEGDKHQAVLDNIEALKAAQPKDLDASEIEVRLGATWIDKEYIRQFMFDTFEPPYYLRYKVEVNFSEVTAEWSISNKSAVADRNFSASMNYGTGRLNPYKILEDTLESEFIIDALHVKRSHIAHYAL